MSTFESLGLAPALLRALAEQGYAEPTPIQAAAVPLVLAGDDLMAGAQTGTGKTAAFALPLLQRYGVDPGAAHAGAPTPRKPPEVWGLFRTPMIGPVADLGREPAGVAEQAKFHHQMEGVHETVALMLLFLLLLHVGGALKHQLVDRERELARMGLGRGRAI